MRARLLISAVLIGALVLVARPAAAEMRPPTGAGAYLDPGGTPTATAQDGGASPNGGGGGGGGGEPPPCAWRVIVEDDLLFAVYDADTFETQHSATGRWLQYVCEGAGPVAVDGAFVTPEGGLVDPAALAESALASIGIDPPVIRTSPSSDGRLYVQIPTWLWLDSSWWRGSEATASAGRVTSTVSARPTSTTWSLGDGTSITCDGPGRAWEPGLGEEATDCSHTYRLSSAGRSGGTFTVEATVTFEISWSSNIGPGGSLPAISRTSTVEVEVGEIQAIGTG